MGALEKLLYVLDLLASFILTRFPYFCILTLLLQAGQRKIKQPDTWFEAMFEPTYVHAIIYFICGGGMTVDATRRVAGLGAALHAGFFAVKTLVKPHVSEWLMVSDKLYFIHSRKAHPPFPVEFLIPTQSFVMFSRGE